MPLVIDLLVTVLADVADQDPSTVEREAKRVPQAERVDLIPPGLAHERVARGHACRGGCPVLWGSIRRSFPSSLRLFWAFSSGSPPPPPSPVPAYRYPSGPNWSWPPLWFECSWVRDHDHRAAGGLDARGCPRGRGTRRSRCCPGDSCSRRRGGGCAPKCGSKAIDRRPRSPPADTRPRMSRNGSGLHVAAIEDPDGPSLLDHVEEPGLPWRVRHVGRGREVPDLVLGDPAARVGGPRVALGGRAGAGREQHERKHSRRAPPAPLPSAARLARAKRSGQGACLIL